MKKQYGFVTALLLATLALVSCTSNVAPNDDSGSRNEAASHDRWLHFMGPRYNAHGIDRDALKVRDDGLLESATRYPRRSSSYWTEKEDRKGYYAYIERLIDCHTGLSVDTAISLLDKNNQVVARHTFDRDHQITQVALRTDEVASHEWPSHNETWMACAAAAQPDAVSNEGLPDSPEDWHPDVAGVGDAPPSTMRGVFKRLHQQYDEHLSDYLARVTDSLAPEGSDRGAGHSGPRWSDAGMRRATQHIDMQSLQADGNGVIEYSTRKKGHAFSDKRWPSDVPNDAVLDTQYMANCRNGFVVPVEQTFREATASKRNASGDDESWKAAGDVLLERSAPVLSTLTGLIQNSRVRGGSVASWSQWHGPTSAGKTGMMCKVAAAQCGASQPAHAFEIDPGKLSRESAAAVLVSARRQWLKYRASFVPSCSFQPE